MARDLLVRPGGKGPRPYPVAIETGIFRRLPEIIPRLSRSGAVFICTDSTVRRLYGLNLQSGLARKGVDATLISFPAGELSKNAGVLEGMFSALLAGRVTRESLLIALGGGVVGDVAGFAASTILRGIPFVQVPTTLLAQVDSSVGGKVGIDRPEGKNLVGSFYHPVAVFIDPSLLKTLPEREYRNGLAEIAKVAVALDERLFRRLVRTSGRLVRRDRRLLQEIVRAAVALKAAVVQKDERDTGVRKSLNLGHTLGHALEAQSGFKMKHGYAVAAGIAGEAAMAERIGLLGPREHRDILALLRSLRLPHRVPRIQDVARFWEALALDKKGNATDIRFVLPAGVGRCAIGVPVPRAAIESVCGVR